MVEDDPLPDPVPPADPTPEPDPVPEPEVPSDVVDDYPVSTVVAVNADTPYHDNPVGDGSHAHDIIPPYLAADLASTVPEQSTIADFNRPFCTVR